MRKYLLPSCLSILAASLFFTFSYADQKINIDDIPQVQSKIDDKANYVDGYFNYKNWKIIIGDSLKNYETGSTLIITNKNNPLSIMIKDNDIGQIEHLSLSGKLISDIGHSLCDMDKIDSQLKINNHIDTLILYDGDPNTRKLTHIVLLERRNGKWNISQRKKINCID